MGCPVVHFEFGGRDAARLSAFYAGVFGWKTQPFGPTSHMFDTGAGTGINGHATALGHEPHNYCVVYVQVSDIPGYIEKAKAAGGSCLIPATEVPGVGHFAWLKDPEGNVFGLWKPAQA